MPSTPQCSCDTWQQMAREQLSKARKGSWVREPGRDAPKYKTGVRERGWVYGQGEPQATRLSRGKAPGDSDRGSLGEQKTVESAYPQRK